MTNNYIIFFCLLCCFFIGCPEKETTPWRLNKEYSAWLTTSSGNYKAMMNKDIAQTVDAIQIYKIKNKQAPQYGLSWIFNQALIYETDNKEFIESFFSAAQEKLEFISDCSKNNIDDDKFYIVALDNTFMRAGVFYSKYAMLMTKYQV
jgi:hypothetical protein